MGRTRANTAFGDTGPAPRLEFEKGRRGLRGSLPTCMDFGVESKRNILHPSGFFCSNCKFYENEISSGKTKKIKRDSHAYACQANHYDWVYPREKWTVSGNQFMSVEEIRQEEERIQKQERADTRAARKRKHEAISISFPLDEEDDVMEGAPSQKNIPNEGDIDSSDNNDESQEIAVLPSLLLAYNNASNVDNQPASNVDNQPVIIQKLREQIAVLELKIAGLRRSVCRWRNRCKDLSENEVGANGSTLIECANDAVEHLMPSECRFLQVSGHRSDKA